MSEERQREVGRFMFSGAIATAVDYALLNFFAVFIGFPVLVANSISAPFSSAVSYRLNKRLVFEDRIHGRRTTVFLYVVILAFGILFIQNVVIHFLKDGAALALAKQLRSLVTEIGFGKVSDQTLAINIAKVMGSLVAAVWNYFMLRRFVFVTQAEANNS